jgi:hypothetical protein
MYFIRISHSNHHELISIEPFRRKANEPDEACVSRAWQNNSFALQAPGVAVWAIRASKQIHSVLPLTSYSDPGVSSRSSPNGSVLENFDSFRAPSASLINLSFHWRPQAIRISILIHEQMTTSNQYQKIIGKCDVAYFFSVARLQSDLGVYLYDAFAVFNPFAIESHIGGSCYGEPSR